MDAEKWTKVIQLQQYAKHVFLLAEELEPEKHPTLGSG